MMWRYLHAGVAVHWGLMLCFTLFEVASNGELARVTDTSDRFSTATVLYFVLLCVATSASAARGFWQEYVA